jgi:hypothetical protein
MCGWLAGSCDMVEVPVLVVGVSQGKDVEKKIIIENAISSREEGEDVRDEVLPARGKFLKMGTINREVDFPRLSK